MTPKRRISTVRIAEHSHRRFTSFNRCGLLASMNSSRHTQTRRQFLGVTGITTGALLVGFPAVLRARSPNDKLNIAIIGCGGRGAGNLAEVSTENIVALCDVNERNLEAAAKKFPQAR